MDRVTSREFRKWIYGVVIAALMVIGGYEIIDEGQIGLWTTLAGSILGIGGSGLALANLTPEEAERARKGR